jgi:SSS family solute:Na+ symporter
LNAHLTLLIVYSIALVAIGIGIGRFVRVSHDFFVAGRRLGPGLIFATVLAANIGAGATVGAAGLGYRDGISAWWWNGSAAIGSVFLALFIGPRIWAVAAKHNLYTAGDYLELRYGPAVRGIVTSLIWLGTLSILAGQLIAGAAVLTVVAGVPHAAGTIISAVVMTVYFMAGGLLSSAWVNAVQLFVLLVGFIMVLPGLLATVSDLRGIMASPGIPATFNDFWYSGGADSGWMLLVGLTANFVVSPGLLQKVYGASSARAVKIGIGLQAIVLAGFAFMPPLFGMVARVSHPGLDNLNLVLPTLLAEQLPVTLGALALAAVFSAEVSTCDALLFMLATSLSQDLYKRFLRPEASDAQLLRVARLASVAGGIGGVLFALQLPTVTDALRIFYSLLGACLLVPVVGGLYSGRAGTREALASIVAGMVTLIAARFVLIARYPWLDPTLAGIAAAAVVFLAVLAARRRPQSRTIEPT